MGKSQSVNDEIKANEQRIIALEANQTKKLKKRDVSKIIAQIEDIKRAILKRLDEGIEELRADVYNKIEDAFGDCMEVLGAFNDAINILKTQQDNDHGRTKTVESQNT